MQITIIIATYNAEKTLKSCLDSIVPQLTDDCELLVIDGGSSDSTLDILSSFSTKISGIISEKDKGIYDAWNKGIAIAKGDWIMFVGADDRLLPSALKEYQNLLFQTTDVDSYDYICACNEYLDSDERLIKIIGGAPQWPVMRKRMPVAHVASLHNRMTLFNSIGVYDLNYKICADYELLLRKREKLRYLFLPICIAQMKAGGMSFSVKAILETYYIRKKHKCIPLWYNLFLLLRDWLVFKLFILRKTLEGNRLS